MRVVKIIAKILILLITIIFLLVDLTTYIPFTAPFSVIIIPFRLFSHITLKFQVILEVIFICIYVIFIRRKSHKNKLILACNIIISITLITNIFSWIRIVKSTSDKSNIEYARDSKTNKESTKQDIVKDYSSKLQIEQCMLYMNSNSKKSSTCIIYLNYGMWSMQREAFGTQIKDFCIEEGYSFARFGAKRNPGENILTLSKKINKYLMEFLQYEKFDNVLLCGGSAGGHLALLCGQMDNYIDGIIALYPCVNPVDTYNYHISDEEKEEKLIQKISNYIFCSFFDSETGSIREDTKKINEKVFGVMGDSKSYYEETAIHNCMNKDVPILIVQGELDSMVPVESSRKLFDFLKKQDKKAVYLELPGVEHLFDILPSAAFDRCKTEMNGFIKAIR